MSNSIILCRTCLREKGAIPLTSTTKGYEDLDFSVMLKLCTSISVEAGDNLPHLICEKCVATLVVAYTFKRQCELSDSLLRSHKLDNFKNITIEIKIEEDYNEINEPQNSLEDFEVAVKSEISDSETNNILEDNIAVKRLYAICKESDDKAENIKNDGPKNRKETIKSHKTKKNSKKHKCPQCEKVFTTRYGLHYHIIQHSGAKNYICPIEKCTKKFFLKPGLKRHMQTHSDEKKYLCYLCGKGYTAADSLRYHIRDHKGERPHLCSQCGKTFKQHIHLKYHMSSHNKERTHVCSKCNRSYLGITQLQKHWKSYCGIGKDPPPKRKTTHFKEA